MKGLAVLAAGVALAVAAIAAPPIAPSPDRSGAMPAGPDPNVNLTESYAKHVGRDAYFWAYPMLASYGRRVVASRTHETVLAGPLPQAPLNHLAMLTETIDPSQHAMASIDLNVIWGIGTLALDVSPVVLQASYLGERYWSYLCIDARGDSFGKLGSMYPDSGGAFLLVGPGWKGETPKGIKRVLRASTNTGTVVIRVYVDGTPEDRRWLKNGLENIAMYPLSEFDGTLKTIAWSKVASAPPNKQNDALRDVDPERTIDILADVLEDVPPFPGEEARYAQVLGVLHAAQLDPKLKAAMVEGAREAEAQLVGPLFAYSNFGREVQHHWRTIDNAGDFGTDYFTRTGVARSNAFIPPAVEVRTYESDTDGRGNALQGDARYEFTVAGTAVPPAFAWSLSLYVDAHAVYTNDIARYTRSAKFAPMTPAEFGLKTATKKPAADASKRPELKRADDGSVTIYVQHEPPPAELRENWLPAPEKKFSLVLRIYGPSAAVGETWTPPAVVRTQ